MFIKLTLVKDDMQQKASVNYKSIALIADIYVENVRKCTELCFPNGGGVKCVESEDEILKLIEEKIKGDK